MLFKNPFTQKNLVIFGFLVAVFPLIFGVLYAATAMRDTAALNRTINLQVFEQTKAIRLVLQKSADIERKGRLFLLLSDPTISEPDDLESYEAARAGFKKALNDLLLIIADNKIVLLANDLSEKENLIYQQIVHLANQTTPDWPVDEGFQALRESSNSLSREFEQLVDHQFNELNGQSSAFESELLAKGSLLLLVSVFCILILLMMISRSMRQLNISVDRLSSGDLRDIIKVSGPADIRNLGFRLEWLRKYLLDLQAFKQQFVNNAARKIQEPLTVVRECREIMLSRWDSEQLSEQERECASRMSESIKQLTLLSDELLQHALIQSSLEVRHKEFVEMAALLEEVIEQFQPRIQVKSLNIKKWVKPVEIFGYIEQLRGVFHDLLANAVNYSPLNGEIRIILRDSGMLMEFEIEDEGVGILPADHPYVFEPFFLCKSDLAEDTPENAYRRLSLVKEYVLNHQGSIDIIDASNNQLGTRIRVRIPLLA